MIWLPGSGIIAAYTDPSTKTISPEFNQALAMYLLSWMAVTIMYAAVAWRISWLLGIDLSFLSVEFLMLACGYMVDNYVLLKTGNALGFIVALLTGKLYLTSHVSN